jgi:spore coat polysaccharide biosynthesis protein SpsF
MTTVSILQARMSSSRLPGKVMQEIAGKPMLTHVLERASQATQVNSVWVATTSQAADDPIEDLCRQQGFACYRGSMHDVLDRYYQAACAARAEVVVRLTADCPLLDPQLVDATLEAFRQGADFAANRLPPPWTRSFPIGLDVEVCSLDALQRAWREAAQPYHREHVMPYLYEGVAFTKRTETGKPHTGDTTYITQGVSAHGFKVSQLHHAPDYGSLRWTVDTPADLELVRQVYQRFSPDLTFSWKEVLALFAREPALAEINADIQHKTAFDVDERTGQL